MYITVNSICIQNSEGSADSTHIHDLHHHMDGTLYQEVGDPAESYIETGPTQTQEGNLFDMATPVEGYLASPYEIPLLISMAENRRVHT